MATYSLDTSDYSLLNRIWDFAQYHGLDMYKSRLGMGIVSWVIDLPEDKIKTRYLLEFAQHSTLLASVE